MQEADPAISEPKINTQHLSMMLNLGEHSLVFSGTRHADPVWVPVMEEVVPKSYTQGPGTEKDKRVVREDKGWHSMVAQEPRGMVGLVESTGEALCWAGRLILECG